MIGLAVDDNSNELTSLFTPALINALSDRDPIRLLQGRYGRILRSRATPETLTEDKGRRLVMVMGSDGLISMVGLSPLQMLEKIGYTKQYILEKIKMGVDFHLLLFRLEDGEALPATWLNVLELAGRLYENTGDILLKARNYLESTSFEEFEAEVGYKLSAVSETDERFVDYAKLLASDGSPQMVRKFLYHTLRLNELFTGTGKTVSEAGLPGVREYAVADGRIAQLREAVLIKLDL